MGAQLGDVSITDLPFHLLLTAIRGGWQQLLTSLVSMLCYLFQVASLAPRLSKRACKPTAKSTTNTRSALEPADESSPFLAGSFELLADIHCELLSLRTQVVSINNSIPLTSSQSSFSMLNHVTSLCLQWLVRTPCLHALSDRVNPIEPSNLFFSGGFNYSISFFSCVFSLISSNNTIIICALILLLSSSSHFFSHWSISASSCITPSLTCTFSTIEPTPSFTPIFCPQCFCASWYQSRSYISIAAGGSSSHKG